jgi:hypothetical protein
MRWRARQPRSLGILDHHPPEPCPSPKLKTAADNSEANAMIAAGSDFTPSPLDYLDAIFSQPPELFAVGVTILSN